MKLIGQHAVVMGASMGGLLAARILSDFFMWVTIIERDEFPAPGEQRKGVPQGKHAHGLHARGREILEQLFPGFTDEVVAQGGLKLDISRDFRWFSGGGIHQPCDSGLLGLLVSRPRLEAHVRARTLALPNVRAREGCSILGVVASEDHSRITGVRLGRHGDAPEEVVKADLVVDATGRGSRSPAWLAELGYEQPQEEQVKIDLSYTTCEFRRTPGQLNGLQGMAIAGELPLGRTGALLAQEGERWIATIGGYLGDQAPLDPQGFLDFAKSLPDLGIYDVIKESEPIGVPVMYKFMANQRRRYEHLTRFPAGFLVFGDAICSFNPVYAQGMTVAANEAMALQRCLRAGSERLAQRFFKQASVLIDAPWSVAVGNDLRLEGVEGKRTPMVKFLNWYVGKLHTAAHNDAALSVTFLHVVNMIAPPPTLLHPGTIWRVVRGNLRRVAAKAPTSVSSPVPVQA